MRWVYLFRLKQLLFPLLLLLLLLLLAEPAFSQTVSHCTQLLSLLPGKVFFPNSSVYSASVASYFALQERLHPSCIVVPSSAEDVASAVKRLSELPDAIFSIRSGGHSSNIGAANNNGGVTVDLRQLRHVTVNSNASAVSVGAGALWTDVYRVLDPRALGVVGGRTGSVGVGGLITGGGISYFSPEHGFACDNVLNMQVVLASGAIVDANASNEHADLFTALKGGQNNFGVVTRFDIRTFPQSVYWGGAIQYPSSADDAQLAVFTAFKDPARFDPHAEIEQSFLYNSSAEGDAQSYSSSNMFYAKPVVNASGLRMFSDIQPQGYNSMRISNSTDFSEELTMFQPVDQYVIYATTTFRISPTILSQVHKLWSDLYHSHELSSVSNLTAVVTFQSIPALSSSHNSLGLPPNSHPEKDLVLCLFSNYWADPIHSAVVENATQSLVQGVNALTASQDLDVRYLYLNYAAAWQDPLRGYGEESLRELVRVARKYDPRRVFQERVSGGFKLPV